MSVPQLPGPAETPTIEVRVYRGDELIERNLAESDEEAAALADFWAEVDGVTCDIDDLAVHHRPGDILEPGAAEPADVDYPASTVQGDATS
ncbi:hypothetical protein [Prauserella flavalba]|uniref:Uncharacterized protein n=1 Tax=Prauserella flavalba TaxID=1477506 RepID=A0A318LSD5_9PSEU|nr:hypothetical protein [Prauserella flavalba]PXY36520.1 hypothetical protein BA062_14120 [Prauserella flavalba]